MTPKINVYIGRFQPLHNGHASIIDNMFANPNDLNIILIGSAHSAQTIKNPFTWCERSEMIISYLESKKYDIDKVQILPIMDQPYNDSKWIESVQEEIQDCISRFEEITLFDEPEVLIRDYEIHLTGSDRDSSTWYLKAFPQYKLNLVPPFGRSLNATAIRKLMFNAEDAFADYENTAHWADMPKTTSKYLEDFMQTHKFLQLQQEYEYVKKYKKAWAAAPYPFNNVAADCVVIQSGHVLLIQRGALPGKGLWALPGGHVGQKDRTQDAAIRELIEETGIKIPEKVLKASIVAKEVFDAPDRSLLGRCYSHAFVFRLDDTLPLPKVKGQNAPLHETDGKAVIETRQAIWFPINHVRKMPDKFFDDHFSIVSWALDAIKD